MVYANASDTLWLRRPLIRHSLGFHPHLACFDHYENHRLVQNGTCPVMGEHSVQTELAQESTASLVTKSGVCLEYLKGACTKDTVCPFSHALKDYYMHVCKRKPHACISKRPAVETLVSTLSQSRYSPGDMAARCKRSYMLRCLIPSIIPGDQKRAEAVVAVLVRSDICLPDI